MEQYIVSARKYRPTTFDSVVGQKALTETLRNAIRTEHLANAYLFCGPRGVGKTTCARIFAKTINCQNPTATHDACNECESCRAFIEQRSFNIHELDAASNNSVEDIRALIDQVRIPPQIGKYSVYIIDEVHMLSQGAFNALLKTLEEPPSYAIFILATTEKHKVLPTILSRCQVYDFSRITVADTISHLQYVAAQEGITVGEDSLNVIAQKADGGMRDALSIFDQLVSFAGTTITYERTIEVLNVLDTDYYFRLTDMALQGQVTEAMLLLNDVLSRGFDAQHFVSGLMQHLRDVLMSKDSATIRLLETSESIRQQYAEQAKRCTAPWLFSALEALNETDVQYRSARNKRLTVELGLIRFCRLLAAPAASVASTVAPAKPAAPTVAPAKPAAPAAAPAQSAASAAPAAAPASPAAPKLGAMPKLPNLSNLANLGRVASPQAATPPPTAPGATPSKTEDRPFSDDQLQRAWIGLMTAFPGEARLLTILEDHHPVRKDEHTIGLVLSNPFQKDLFREFGQAVMSHLRQQLHHASLRLELEINEVERQHQAYTQEEKFKVLVDANPELQNLRDALALQLE